MRRSLTVRLIAFAAALVVPSAVYAQSAADVALLERGRALALDDRCGLFSSPVRAALESGWLLARNGLQRGGWSAEMIAGLIAEASAQADSVGCESSAMVEVIARVEDGYAGWINLAAMTFVGDHRTWEAQRPRGMEGWLVVQDISTTESGFAVFGLARREDGSDRLAIAVSSALRPRAARARMRDVELAPELIDPELRRLASPTPSHPLAALAAPDVFTTQVWAAERMEVEGDSPFSASDDASLALFWFPEDASTALSTLDAREAMSIDVEFASRSTEGATARFYLEVGDFESARLFATTNAR